MYRNAENRVQLEYRFWILGVCLGAFLLGMSVVLHYNPTLLDWLRYDCRFHKVTGMYCPGCGGTRAVFALLYGNILVSLCYHPVVLYVVVFYVTYMVRGIIAIWSKGKYSFMKWRLLYVYIGVGILLLQFLLKNLLLIVFHIAWI